MLSVTLWIFHSPSLWRLQHASFNFAMQTPVEKGCGISNLHLYELEFITYSKRRSRGLENCLLCSLFAKDVALIS